MGKTTTNPFAGYRVAMPVAVSFMLMPSLVFAQTEEQVVSIRKVSDFKTLNFLKQDFKKNTLSISDLKTLAKKKNIPFSGTIENKYYELRGFETKTGKPLYYVTYNKGAGQGTLTDRLHSDAGIFNLEGEDMVVYEWDGGKVLLTHQEFGGRVTQGDDATGVNSHATHVAGTMVASGVDGNAKGMAPKAKLVAHDWNNDMTEMIAAAEKGALISNHSYGFAGAFEWGDWSGATGWHWLGDDEETEYRFYGKYTTEDRKWDVFTLGAPHYLPVKAAGNPRGDGPEAGGLHYVRVKDANGDYVWTTSTKVRQKNGGALGYDTILHGALAKNILTVGAAQKISGGYTQPTDVQMASFSGYGPVDDGRIKPDITGVGVSIYSTGTANTTYDTMSGTSMASPNVTGSLLLLQELYKNKNNGAFMRAATLKALAIATANEAGANDGPDYASGWGLLNAYKAATAISLRDKTSLIEEKTLQNGNTDTIQVTAANNEPLVVTIAWADPISKTLPSESTLNERTKTLVNDLDLRIVDTNGTEYLPWKLDPANPNNAATKADNTVDNVEQVVIKNPVAGQTYTIKVSHKDTLKKNTVVDGTIDLIDTTGQDYSMIVTGINKGLNNDIALESVKVAVPQVQYSSSTPVQFRLINKGLSDANGVKIKYEIIDKTNSQTLKTEEVTLSSTIPVNGEHTETINVDLSKSFVDIEIKANVIYANDEIAENNFANANVFGIIADITADGASHSFDFEDNFAKNGWTREDVNGDGRSWGQYTQASLARSGSSFAVNLPSNTAGTNDWIFSNPLRVKANTKYKVSFYIRKFQYTNELLNVAVGDAPNSAAMTQVLATNVAATDDGFYKKFTYEVTFPTDKVVYFGFNNKAESDTATTYGIGLDDASFVNVQAGKPYAEFSASKTLRIHSFETVSLTNESVAPDSDPITKYEWTITGPDTVTFEDGTSATSENPKVKFGRTNGTYTVSLKVTNSKGESTNSKTDYLTVRNVLTTPQMTNSNPYIYEGQTVKFTNISTGNPAPHTYLWETSPTEGVEFVEGTDKNSKDVVIKFNKEGVYDIKLSSYSVLNARQLTSAKLVNVKPAHAAVRNLTSSLATSDKELTLKWDNPTLNSLYFEGFEGNDLSGIGGRINNNDDNYTWRTGGFAKKTGQYSIASLSWWMGVPHTADDWLVLPKIKAGAEVLKYAVKHQYLERYDVYVVYSQGDLPTADEINDGIKIYTFDGEEQSESFINREFNIKEHTTKDFHIVFHHRTKAEDDGLYLALDDIEIGYDNTIAANAQQANISVETDNKETEKVVFSKDKDKIITTEMMEELGLNNTEKVANSLPTNTIKPLGILNLPTLTGYEIVKDGVSIKTNANVDEKTYKEIFSGNVGTITYDVYALYSDGVKSEKQTVTIDTTPLSASEVAVNDRLKVYPNPSDGRFVIEAKTGVSKLYTEVYDASGKLIFKKEYQGNKADLDLTQYPKGIYLLNVVDNNGQRQTVKLIIK